MHEDYVLVIAPELMVNLNWGIKAVTKRRNREYYQLIVQKNPVKGRRTFISNLAW